MKHKLLPLVVTGCLSFATSSHAKFNAPWEFYHVSTNYSIAKWCAEGGELGKGYECHALECKLGQVHYTVTKAPKVRNTTSNSFRIFVDVDMVHKGVLKVEAVHDTYETWISTKPIPFAAQQMIAAGSLIGVERFDTFIQNSLKGSGAAMKQLWRTCGVNTQTASASTNNTQSLRSGRLEDFCKPYDGLVNYATGYTTPGLHGARYTYVRRRGTRASHHDIGLRKFSDVNGFFEGSIAYHGADTQATSFRFRLPSNNLTLTPAIKKDLRKIRDLAIKYFEWKDVAQQNNVTKFRKDFPTDLRPSIANRSNFRFTVSRRHNDTFYGLQNMHEHGFCWLYQQVLNVDQIFSDAQKAIFAERARENLAKQRQNNLSNQFQ